MPGNHDEALREYAGSEFGDIRVVREAMHTAADGRRYLLIHGDEFDQITRYHRWVALLGDIAYDLLLRLNGVAVLGAAKIASARLLVACRIRQAQDQGRAGIRVRLRGVGRAPCAADGAGRRGLRPYPQRRRSRLSAASAYINCGDWVDSCTAIVEHDDGRMELVHWLESEVPERRTCGRRRRRSGIPGIGAGAAAAVAMRSRSSAGAVRSRRYPALRSARDNSYFLQRLSPSAAIFHAVRQTTRGRPSIAQAVEENSIMIDQKMDYPVTDRTDRMDRIARPVDIGQSMAAIIAITRREWMAHARAPIAPDAVGHRSHPNSAPVDPIRAGCGAQQAVARASAGMDTKRSAVCRIGSDTRGHALELAYAAGCLRLCTLGRGGVWKSRIGD